MRINFNTTNVIQTKNNSWGTTKNNQPSFKAYVYSPHRAKWALAKLNPLTEGVDQVIERSLKFAQVRLKPVSKSLEPITKRVDLGTKATKPLTYAWDINTGERQQYVLFIHGTGQNITNLQTVYKDIIDKTNFAVLAPEFRGFGANPPAKISSKTLLTDATLALDYLLQKGIKKKDITVVSHSLGCQVATSLTVKNKDIGRLVLMSPINSFATDMSLDQTFGNSVPEKVLLLYKKFAFLSRPFDNFYGIGKIIKKVKSPVDIIHSQNDTLVKPIAAQEISKKCKNLSSLTILEEGSHRIDLPKTNALMEILTGKN